VEVERAQCRFAGEGVQIERAIETAHDEIDGALHGLLVEGFRVGLHGGKTTTAGTRLLDLPCH